MELSRIIISETNDEQVIVLKEIDGQRAFPIVIGIWEAVAIDRNLKGKRTPRPMTHDLIENVLAGMEASLERIVVTDLRDRTFFAKLVIRKDGKVIDIDSRPSDAIALAVQMQVPIFVAPSVLEDVTPGTGLGGLTEHGPEDEGEEEDPDEGEVI